MSGLKGTTSDGAGVIGLAQTGYGVFGQSQSLYGFMAGATPVSELLPRARAATSLRARQIPAASSTLQITALT